MEALDLIQEGNHVIFDEHGEKKSIHIVSRTGRAKVGKTHIQVGQLIGMRWGSSYKLSADGTKLLPITEHEPVSGLVVDEVDKDNSTLLDLNVRNQGLTAKDIAEMAASGKAGKEIIEALCSNSVTYAEKTEFAQEKYKKRKARKYMTTLTLRKPTAWTMCEVMFDKAPTGIWNLRPDSLSLLLSLANVAAHSRCLLLENCQGLLAAACAERMGGYGALCCVGTGGKIPGMSGLRQLNLSQQERSIVCCTQLADLQSAAQRLTSLGQQESADQQPETQQQQLQQHEGQQQQLGEAQAAPADISPTAVSGQQAEAFAVDNSETVATALDPAAVGVTADDVSILYDTVPEPVDAPQPTANTKRRRISGQQLRQQQEDTAVGCAAAAGADDSASAAEADPQSSDATVGRLYRPTYTAQPEQLYQLLSQGFSSCVIAAPRLHTCSILQQVLPLLAPSTPFAVFSPWMQPLAEAWQHLSSSRQAVLLQLQESWMRPYQVLPGRTHPHMAMTTGGTGGYILSGMTVAASKTGNGQQEQEGRHDGRGSGGKRGRGGRRAKRQR